MDGDLTVEDLQGLVQCKFLRIVEPAIAKPRNGRKRKTRIIELRDNRDILIATLKWHPGWRSYTFWPADRTLWDTKCLADVVSVLDALRAEHRASRGYDLPDKCISHPNPATRRSVF